MSHINLPRVAVLMSTYNGEQYIVEQIDSILLQEGVEVNLYIRDDGSTDNTVNIIKSYKNNNIYLFQDGENLGPGMSFMRLLYKVANENDSYEYYAFADQDDIWLKNKLLVAVCKLGNKQESALYCSNQYLYINEKVESLRFNKEPELTLVSHISKNDISGCTMVLNRKLTELVTSVKCPIHDILDYRCHDTWILLITILFGTVIYDTKSYIYYRIHDNNVVGIKKMTFIDRLKRWIVGKNSTKVPARNLRMKCAQQLLEQFPEAEGEDVVILREFAQYQQGLGKRIALIKDKRIREASGEGFLYFAVKVMCNMI